MNPWIILLIIIAFSLFSTHFAWNLGEVIENHAIAILLVCLGILYGWYIREWLKREK